MSQYVTMNRALSGLHVPTCIGCSIIYVLALDPTASYHHYASETHGKVVVFTVVDDVFDPDFFQQRLNRNFSNELLEIGLHRRFQRCPTIKILHLAYEQLVGVRAIVRVAFFQEFESKFRKEPEDDTKDQLPLMYLARNSLANQSSLASHH